MAELWRTTYGTPVMPVVVKRVIRIEAPFDLEIPLLKIDVAVCAKNENRQFRCSDHDGKNERDVPRF